MEKQNAFLSPIKTEYFYGNKIIVKHLSAASNKKVAAKQVNIEKKQESLNKQNKRDLGLNMVRKILLHFYSAIRLQESYPIQNRGEIFDWYRLDLDLLRQASPLGSGVNRTHGQPLPRLQ